MATSKKIIKNLKKKMTKEEIEELAIQDQVSEIIIEANNEAIVTDITSLPHYADVGTVGIVNAITSSTSTAGMSSTFGYITGGMAMAGGIGLNIHSGRLMIPIDPVNEDRDFSLDESKGSTSSANPFETPEDGAIFADVMSTFLKGHIDTLNQGEIINIYRNGELLGSVQVVKEDGTWYFGMSDDSTGSSYLYEAVLVKNDGTTLIAQNNISPIAWVEPNDWFQPVFEDVLQTSSEGVSHESETTIAFLSNEPLLILDPLIYQIL